MKKQKMECLKPSWYQRRRVFVAIAILIALAFPVWADDDWVTIGENSNGIFQLNQRSIEDRGDYIIGWTRHLYSDYARSLMSGASYGMTLYGAAKGSKQIRSFQMLMYDKNGNVTSNISERQLKENWLGEWEYCAPGAPSEWIWEAMMKAAGVSR